MKISDKEILRHYDAIYILLEPLTKAAHEGRDVPNKEACDALRKWDKARTTKKEEDINKSIGDEMETTEGLSVPDALELIAKWIREGMEIEQGYKTGAPAWIPMPNKSRIKNEDQPAFGLVELNRYIYRAKPQKLRIIGDFVEMNSKVRAVLEKAGLL